MQSDFPDPAPLSRGQVLVLIAVTALILLAIAKAWQALGQVRLFPWEITPQGTMQGFALALGISALSALIYRIWPAYRRSADQYLTFVLKPLVWGDLLWLGLLPALSEELLFRGVMLPAFGSGLVALMLSSLIFGVLHWGSREQWPYGLWATGIGFLLGGTAILTGNLYVAVLAHGCTNWIAAFVWKIRLGDPSHPV